MKYKFSENIFRQRKGKLTMSNAIIQKNHSDKKKQSIDTSIEKLSHEVNNYLSVLYSQMQYMEKKYRPLEKDEDWSVIKEEAKNLSSTLYRLTYPAKELPKEYFILNRLLEEIYNAWKKRFQKKGYSLYYIYEQALPIQFLGYPSDFVQIMNNLLSNSYDALERVSKNGEVIILLKYYKNQIILKIEDNGCGIPFQDLEHIFDYGMSKKQSGHGIGLSIVKDLVERNSGYITVDSTPNRGTTFCLSFSLT